MYFSITYLGVQICPYFQQKFYAHTQAQAKYDKDHTTGFYMKLNLRSDRDILQWFWKQKSKQDRRRPEIYRLQPYGHFLICYLSLFLLRVLVIKVFKNKINAYVLIHFMRDFRVVDKGDGSYINISRNQAVNEKVKTITGLSNLDALFLSEKEVESFFQNCMLLDS